ncbi:MAG: hypothetical protein JO282_06220 [Alphaproteobacteria bacterium]|nr:hypothetical protein [Alphaproteobacteria bacterium]
MTEIDIWRTVYLMLWWYGDTAKEESVRRSDRFVAAGSPRNRYQVVVFPRWRWRRISKLLKVAAEWKDTSLRYLSPAVNLALATDDYGREPAASLAPASTAKGSSNCTLHKSTSVEPRSTAMTPR